MSIAAFINCIAISQSHFHFKENISKPIAIFRKDSSFQTSTLETKENSERK